MSEIDEPSKKEVIRMLGQLRRVCILLAKSIDEGEPMTRGHKDFLYATFTESLDLAVRLGAPLLRGPKNRARGEEWPESTAEIWEAHK